MSGVNKVIIVGRLGNDPELKYTGTGQAVARLSIATSEEWNDKQGQKQERTEWHRIVVWGKLGELCGKYLSKGRQVYLEGRLQTRSWEDKDGQKKYTTEVVANTVQFLGAGGQAESHSQNEGGGNGGGNGGRGEARGSAGSHPTGESMNQNFPPEPSFDSDEDIPF